MANFLIIRDPDPTRRREFLARATGMLRSPGKLHASSMEAGDWSLSWACFQGAPVEIANAADGSVEFLLGEAFDESDGVRVRSPRVCEGVRSPSPESFDGFHMVARIDPSRDELLLGADILGTFPVYFATRGDVVVASTRPDVLLGHPCVDGTIDPVGLAGILHSCGLVGVRTLHRGVSRLPPRKVALLRPHLAPVYRSQKPLRPAGEDLRRCAEAGTDELVEFLQERASRHMTALLGSGGRHGLLLSGGLDSRMVAGLARQMGLSPRCLTFGSVGEIENATAAIVARTLGWPRKRMTEPVEQYPDIAHGILRRELLSNGLGFSFGPILQDPSFLGDFGDRLLAGFQLDYLASGCWTWANPEQWLRKGFTIDEMDSLGSVRPLGQAWRELSSSLRELYARHDDEVEYVLALDHRARFHVGSNLWRSAHGAWPATPALCRGFATAWMSLPPRAFTERRTQQAFVLRHFPDLARIPLDRNDLSWFTIDPRGPSFRHLIELRLRRKLAHTLGLDPRYYVNTYDLGTPHWNVLRERAEPGREALKELVDPAALDRLLPPPGAIVPLDRGAPIPSAAPRKILIGLMTLLHDPS